MNRSPRGEAPPRALTCDLWHTLVTFRGRATRSYENSLRGVWGDELARNGIESGPAQRLVFSLEKSILQEERRGRSIRIRDQVGWLSRRANVPLNAQRIERGITTAVRRAPIYRASGAAAALRILRRRGIRLGVVSNVIFEPERAIRELLRRQGLTPWFDAVVLSCDLGSTKPSPEPFQTCLRQLGVAPSHAAHIGDDPLDIAGAHRAGMQAILIPRRRARRPSVPKGPLGGMTPDAVVRSWDAAPATVERLLR